MKGLTALFARAAGLVLALTTARSQPLSFGLEAGVPITGSIRADPSAPGSATTNRYIAGGSIEVRLPRHLSLEFDALYRHLHYADFFGTPLLGGEFERVSAGTWEFPLLVKYHFRGDAARPFVSTGAAFETVALKNRFIAYSPFPSPEFTTGTDSSSLSLQNSIVGGLAAGAGIEVRAGRLHVTPEIRYTRWLTPHFSLPYTLESKQNQVEFLLGFRL